MITNQLGKSFVEKEYKKKRERDLFETEKALMPETQNIAVRMKRIKDINKEIAFVSEHLRELKRQRTILEAGGEPHTHKKPVKDHMIKCPVGECRGFVNSADHKCGICDTNVCKDCREPLAGALEHTCDPNTLETVRLLRRDTKSCPKCGVGIHKIEGCDQMYCTQCHTAFSWRTGEIVIGGRIHNPHYYEYLRMKGGGDEPRREIGDIPCGGLPTNREMWPHGSNAKIMNAYRTLVHIEEVEFHNYRTDRIQGNRDLRIKYLNNEITEDKFKQDIQKKEKDVEKKREILQVLNTCVVVGSEIMRRLLSDETKNEEKACGEFVELCSFINESMKKVSKLYNCKVPILQEYPLADGCSVGAVIAKHKF
jgi:hypothetical protein